MLASYSEPRDVPYAELLRKALTHEESARRVQLVGWYFPHLIDGARSESFREFLAGRGKLDIVIPDVSDKSIAASLAEMRSSESQELDARGMANLACASVRGFELIRAKAGVSAGAVRVFTRRAPVNYAAYCFAGRDLIFGPYEHAFDPSARAPRLHLDPAFAGTFAAFWRAEFVAMTAGGDGINIEEWLAAVASAHPAPSWPRPATSRRAAMR